METLQAGRADPWYMLDNAQTCLTALTQMPKRVVPTVPPLGPEAYAATVLLADAGATARAHAMQAGVSPPMLQGVAPTLHQSAQPPIGSKPIHIDPELLALYIEEAREEIARIGKLFPAWEQNPLETEALGGVRRAFHTLKGSGRMVGATDISEFAWAIENLLNKVIENTLARSPAIRSVSKPARASPPTASSIATHSCSSFRAHIATSCCPTRGGFPSSVACRTKDISTSIRRERPSATSPLADTTPAWARRPHSALSGGSTIHCFPPRSAPIR
jgi:HPt (histidine-containing phosphotransfer) domain-containing protein